jgi:hypothetical protein
VNGSIRILGCRISNSTLGSIHRTHYPLLHRLLAAQPNLPPPSWFCILFFLFFYINGFSYFHVVGLGTRVAWINSQTLGAAERGLAITWHGAQWRSWPPAIPNVRSGPGGRGRWMPARLSCAGRGGGDSPTTQRHGMQYSLECIFPIYSVCAKYLCSALSRDQ